MNKAGPDPVQVMKFRIALIGVVLAFALAPARAQDEAAPLLPDQVLAASAQHFPLILESLAKRSAAEGRVVAADGAFDLVFSVDGYDRVSGFWTGGVVNTDVRRRLRPLGATVYGGYRISDGTFPIYEDINFTNTGGEAKIGALFSLLRDRSIDSARFQTRDARLALQQADLEVLLTRIGVQQQAVVAYWRWIAAGRQLRVYEQLLRLAQSREAGLEEQVRSGARAAIFLTENRQNITRRQRLVFEARRDFQTAANALSFYYRGPDGAPLTPTPEQLPPMEFMDRASEDAIDADASTLLAAAARRPELAILKTALDRARAKTALSHNDLKPRLDLRAEVSRDFGDIAEGGVSRDSTDTILGLRFTVPLQRREAKGRLRAAEAEYEAAKQQRRYTLERIELEIRNILIDLDVSQDLARIADLEVDQSQTMEEAERERFANGASDFFVVNVREETAADARVRAILARLQLAVARANYDAATVDLERLGINEAANAETAVR